MKAKLPWTTIAVVFEMSDFLACLGLLTASALTFLVELQSDLSLLDSQLHQSLDHTSQTHCMGACPPKL